MGILISCAGILSSSSPSPSQHLRSRELDCREELQLLVSYYTYVLPETSLKNIVVNCLNTKEGGKLLAKFYASHSAVRINPIIFFPCSCSTHVTHSAAFWCRSASSKGIGRGSRSPAGHSRRGVRMKIRQWFVSHSSPLCYLCLSCLLCLKKRHLD
jgi:hypothetical protein